MNLFEALESMAFGDIDRIDVPPEWCVIGPNGGFVAACAARSAGRHLEGKVPVAVNARFISGMHDGALDLTTEVLKAGKQCSFAEVRVTQDGQLVASVSVIASSVPGSLEHYRGVGEHPDLPAPASLPTITEHRDEGEATGFERLIEQRPIEFLAQDHDRTPASADYAAWFRFLGAASHPDPFADIGRLLVIADITPLAALDAAHPVVLATHWGPTATLNVERPAGHPIPEDLFVTTRVSGLSNGILVGQVQFAGPDGLEVAGGSQVGLLRQIV